MVIARSGTPRLSLLRKSPVLRGGLRGKRDLEAKPFELAHKDAFGPLWLREREVARGRDRGTGRGA